MAGDHDDIKNPDLMQRFDLAVDDPDAMDRDQGLGDLVCQRKHPMAEPCGHDQCALRTFHFTHTP